MQTVFKIRKKHFLPRPRWPCHNGGARQAALMAVSDWFQAWLALIESPQEAPGNHGPAPEALGAREKPDWGQKFHSRAQRLHRRPPIEVQYIPALLQTPGIGWIVSLASIFNGNVFWKWSNWSFDMSQHVPRNTKTCLFSSVTPR